MHDHAVQHTIMDTDEEARACFPFSSKALRQPTRIGPIWLKLIALGTFLVC